jgi:hypothetical protein
MLEIVYWAKETRSFGAAEKALTRNSAIIDNAATIRAVVNTVGNIVLQNDVFGGGKDLRNPPILSAAVS